LTVGKGGVDECRMMGDGWGSCHGYHGYHGCNGCWMLDAILQEGEVMISWLINVGCQMLN